MRETRASVWKKNPSPAITKADRGTSSKRPESCARKKTVPTRYNRRVISKNTTFILYRPRLFSRKFSFLLRSSLRCGQAVNYREMGKRESSKPVRLGSDPYPPE